MNILINGMGRIGKSILRILSKNKNHTIVAINEINTNIENIAYTINYDSTYGRLEDKFSYDKNSIFNINGIIKILNEPSLEAIDFITLKIDIVVDASGAKIDRSVLEKLPCKAVFLTHPNKQADINLILGVNEEKLQKGDKIISTSSCNATALMPMLKLLDDNYGLDSADIVTIHPLLNHQKTLDSNCVGSSDREIECNFEFGRSATQNIIPSLTTTITACSYVDSRYNHQTISSSSLRVPTPTVGAINLCANLQNATNIDSITATINSFIKNQSYNILKLNDESLVSSDFQSETFTTIIDARYLQIINNTQLKALIWYDNEYGYASKVVDILDYYSTLYK